MAEVLDWVNFYSGAVQAIATVILVIVTSVYVILTGRVAGGTSSLARETKALADATTKMLAEANLARLNALLPVIGHKGMAFSKKTWEPGKDHGTAADAIVMTIFNGGVGPAVDVAIEVDSNKTKYFLVTKPELPSLREPFSLSAGASQELTFRVYGEMAPVGAGTGIVETAIIRARYRDIYERPIVSEFEIQLRGLDTDRSAEVRGTVLHFPWEGDTR